MVLAREEASNGLVFRRRHGNHPGGPGRCSCLCEVSHNTASLPRQCHNSEVSRKILDDRVSGCKSGAEHALALRKLGAAVVVVHFLYSAQIQYFQVLDEIYHCQHQWSFVGMRAHCVHTPTLHRNYSLVEASPVAEGVSICQAACLYRYQHYTLAYVADHLHYWVAFAHRLGVHHRSGQASSLQPSSLSERLEKHCLGAFRLEILAQSEAYAVLNTIVSLCPGSVQTDCLP